MSLLIKNGRIVTATDDYHGDVFIRGETVVAVSHSDVIKTVVCGVLGLSLDRYHAFEIAPASLTRLVVWPGGGKILALNETAT